MPIRRQPHAGAKPLDQGGIDKKDLAAVWSVGLLLSLLMSVVGLSWNPARYEARLSNSVDQTEAQVENNQNKMVADALNVGKIQYHPTMEKLVQPISTSQTFFVDIFKVLLFPTVPVIIVGMLIRKTIQQSKKQE